MFVSCRAEYMVERFLKHHCVMACADERINSCQLECRFALESLFVILFIIELGIRWASLKRPLGRDSMAAERCRTWAGDRHFFTMGGIFAT